MNVLDILCLASGPSRYCLFDIFEVLKSKGGDIEVDFAFAAWKLMPEMWCFRPYCRSGLSLLPGTSDEG